MNHQNELQDHHLMQKLQQIIPQLRKQIESSLRSKHEQHYKKKIEEKKKQLKHKYQLKIKENIQNKNGQIKTSLNQMIEMIDNYKHQHKNKNKGLSKEQEDVFIEQTVEEIVSNHHMLQEVKNRLRPKIQMKVKLTLDRQLQNGIQLVKRQLLEKIQQQRQIWSQQRIQHWKQQSSLQLEELAIEHNELNDKKISIQANLNAKKNEKTQLQQRLQLIMDKNTKISYLRRELKQLKQQIKC